MKKGLSDSTSVGRTGTYRGERAEAVMMATCVARAATLHTAGEHSVPLGGPRLPDSYSLESVQSSWTGLRYVFRWNGGGGLTVEHRATLPGPLYIPRGRSFRLRFEFGDAPECVRDLTKGRVFRHFLQRDLGRAFHLIGGRVASLLICGASVRKWRVVTHEHLEITFDRPGVPVMWVPLLDASDAPAKDQLQLYLRMVKRPPLHCSEEFDVVGPHVKIRQAFTDHEGRPAAIAPIPPLQALLRRDNHIQRIPRGRHLLDTLIGPLRYVDAPSWEGTIDSRWMDARGEATRAVRGRLPTPPSELSYAGDVSWNPREPMDGLITANTWAPLAGIAPARVWKRVKQDIHIPTPAQLRRSLLTIREPTIGRSYCKDTAIFGERGDVSFDTDWYNGKTLAGIYRGLMCSDPEIRSRSEQLVKGSEAPRRGLHAYMEIYHDWALGNSWTDPRGETWNTDCSHLGMGGVVAQSKICEWEGNLEGSQFSRYLAAKMALSFIAAYPLGDWCAEKGFVLHRYDEPLLGIKDLREWRGAVIDGPGSRSPYGLCPDFPEFQALLKLHGPVERWRRAVRIWETQYPERYRDWAFFYTGLRRDVAVRTLNQEERIQAAIHYHLAPEVALRLFVLEQDPDLIEGLYGKRKPALAEILWLRSAARLVIPEG